jgi:hypothetical protein
MYNKTDQFATNAHLCKKHVITNYYNCAQQRIVAAIKYSGTWSKSRYNEKKSLLEEFIDERGLKAAGEAIWARYDPPFMPWFLRSNEILIPIEN